MDPDLDAVIISAKLTRGVEVQGHFLRVIDVVASVARTWHELGANCYGVELWKLINLNFYHDLDIEKWG